MIASADLCTRYQIFSENKKTKIISRFRVFNLVIGGRNVEYLYAFMARTEKHAYVVLRVEEKEEAEAVLTGAGFKMITDSDIQKL